MKFAVDAARKASDSDNMLVLPHFFNARGTALQQSAEGMYRTLLVRLLETLSVAEVEQLQQCHQMYQARPWPIPQLQRLLKDAVVRLKQRPAAFFIDALDECNQQDVRKMLSFFRDIVESAWEDQPRRQIRVLFASRPYPYISFNEATFLDLGDESEHIKDIARYIEVELRIGKNRRATEIRHAVLEKAAGVFMWTVLVVYNLNEAYDNGNVDLEKQLEEMPEGLHMLYRYVLDRHQTLRDELRACLRWLLFASDAPPLNAGQLWWAIQLTMGRSDDEIHGDYHKQTAASIRRYITAVSKGFAEFKRDLSRPVEKNTESPENYLVQLAHESVRDFVFTDIELRHLYSLDSRKGFEAQSHEILRDACFAELSARSLQPFERKQLRGYWKVELGPLGWQEWSDPSKKTRFPMALYAARNATKHANSAQECGLDQQAFLRKFKHQFGPRYLSPGPNPWSTWQWYELRLRHGLICLLFENKCGALLRKSLHEVAQYSLFSDEGLLRGDIDSVLQQVDLSFDTIREMILRSDDYQPYLRQLLKQLSDGKSIRAADCNGLSSPLLALSFLNPARTSFFLLISVPSGALEPHISLLKQIFNDLGNLPRRGNALDYEQLLQVIILFITKALPSEYLDFADEEVRYTCASCVAGFIPFKRSKYIHSELLRVIMLREYAPLRMVQILQGSFPFIHFEPQQGPDTEEQVSVSQRWSHDTCYLTAMQLLRCS